MALKDLQVNIGANTTGFNKGIKTVQSGIKSMGSGLASLAKTGLALAGITAGVAAIAQSFKAYVSLESSVSRVNSLFLQSSKYITYFAETTAKSFGMAESSAYQYSAVYGNLFRNITKDTEENAKVTIAMLKSSAVVASKTGRTMEDVMERIRSGLLGNTEAIEDLGIHVNVAMLETTDAFAKIANGRSWDKLTFYEQQQIRTLAILEQSHKNFGDEVQQGSAYSLSTLSGAFKDLQSTAGAFINKALAPIVAWLTKVVQWATLGLKSLAGMMGVNLKGGVSDASAGLSVGADSTEAMADNTSDTAKSAKEIKKNLMGFDELNVLSPAQAETDKDSGANSGGGASVFDSLPALELGEISAPSLDTSGLEKSFAVIKRGFKDIITDIKKNFAPSIESLSGLWKGIKKPASDAFGSVKSSVKNVWTDTLQPFATYTLTNFIPSIANGFTTTFAPIFSSYLSTIFSQFALDFQFACTNISMFTTDILQPAMERVKTVATDIFAGIKTAWDIYGGDILQGFTDFKESLRETWLNIYGKIIEPVITNIGKKFDVLWENHLKGLWENVTKFIGSVADFLLSLWNNVLSPYINYLIDVWAPYFKSVFNTVSDVVSTVVGMISDFIGGLLQTLRGVLDFLTGVFTGDWDKAWQGIKDIYEGVMNALEGIAKGAVNLVIDVINGMINGIWAGIQGIVNGVGGIVEKIGEALGKDWDLTVPGDAPQIPKLARGGLATAPTIAMVGDNKNARIDPEVIAPLSKLEDMIGNKLMQIMQINQMSPAGAGYTGDITIQCILDEREIGRAAVRYQNGQRLDSNGR